MKFLLIEDDEEKLRRVSEFLETEFPNAHVEVARSFNSGLRHIIFNSDMLDLVLLDMSMPNYDISPNEPTGGAPESFAGSELLAQMQLRGIEIPTVVITMFDSFGESPRQISLDKLVFNLKERFVPIYRGLVYYSAAQEGWRVTLKKLIIDAVGMKE